MRKTVELLMSILMVALGACSKDAGNVAGPARRYSLKVLVQEGVDGQLKSGTYSHDSGTVVSYSYVPAAGYRRLFVEVDGTEAAQSGQIAMSRDREVLATAEPVPVLEDKAKPILSDVVRFVTATDSISVVKSYTDHLKALDALYASDPAKAGALALAAYRQMLEETPDAQLDSIETFLSGRLFGIDGEVAYAGASLKISIIFVNGILKTYDAAAVSRKELEMVVKDAGLSERVGVYNFYNSTSRHEPDKLRRCRRRAIELESYSTLRSCGGLALDLVEASRQIGEIINNLPAEAVPEVRALENLVREERASGRSLILVGHSQGTMLVTQALKNLGGNDPCISAISVAGPLGQSSWQGSVPSENLEGFIVAGERTEDILLALGHNDFPKIATNLSREADNRVRALANPNIAVAYAAVSEIFENLKLHGFGRSYTAGVESREKLQALIRKHVERLEGASECKPVRTARIYASSAKVSHSGSVSDPSDLWVVPPYEEGVDTLVGRIKTASGRELVIVDVAEAPDGELYAITFNDLYRLDKSSGAAELVKAGLSSRSINALAFDSQGNLYTAALSGEVRGYELETLEEIFRSDLGSGFESSGDLAYSPEGRMYAVIKDSQDREFLATLDLSTGSISKICENPISWSNVWGLNFVGDRLFGLTADTASGMGSLVSIDRATCAGTLVRKLKFNATGASIRSN